MRVMQILKLYLEHQKKSKHSIKNQIKYSIEIELTTFFNVQFYLY